MIHDLTRGRITSSLLLFALPMMAGNLLQQLYNIADTLIVGRALGNSTSPLWFLGISALLNVGLDLLFVAVLPLGIGCLFLFYGYYRAVDRAGMSVVLTVVSLGLRVLLAYLLAATALREAGIRLSIPIGWVIADVVGLLCMQKRAHSAKSGAPCGAPLWLCVMLRVSLRVRGAPASARQRWFRRALPRALRRVLRQSVPSGQCPYRRSVPR